MKKVFVCSPFAGDVKKNVNTAIKICRHVTLSGHAPFAPHVFYPLFLHECVRAEREIGIKSGVAYLRVCDEMWIHFDDRRGMSAGMLQEVKAAKDAGVLIFRFTFQRGIKAWK